MNSGTEPDLSHPIFDPVRPWHERLRGSPSLHLLNSFSEEKNLRTESGKAIRFVEPRPSNPYYEVHLFESGEINTRPESRHDLFNALCWLAFPKTKARINALHARAIPREGGKRGRLRDMLTLLDEGGALVRCADESLRQLVRNFSWKELFWSRRVDVLNGLHVLVLGHATLEMALDPWPGITCKAIFLPADRDADASAADWLAEPRTPEALSALPVFGYPGWHRGNDDPSFYDDGRYFRPFRRTPAKIGL